MENHSQNESVQLGPRFSVAVGLTAFILAAELIGGYLANSLALISDAGHVFTDLLALALSWFGIRQAEKPATSRMSYGYHRYGILIALFNAITIILIVFYILYEAYQRYLNPHEPNSVLMVIVAAVGLIVNLIVIMLLQSKQHTNLNVRSAFIHALGDALSSVGVIIGAVIIYFTNFSWIDPLLSVMIGIVIAFTAGRLVKESFNILLEAAPGRINLDKLKMAMMKLDGVKDIHDLHVWTIAPGMTALSTHVLVEDIRVSECSMVGSKLKEMLTSEFDIWHTTFQFECMTCAPETLCYIEAPEPTRGEDPEFPGGS